MSKTTIWLIAGVIVIAGGLMLSKNNPPVEDTQDPMQNIAENTGGKKMSFDSFVQQGGSYQCTVSQYVDAGYSSTTQGTVFISGGNISGSYDISANGMNLKASTIVKDGYVYSWTSMAPIGYKTKAIADAATNSNTGMSGTYGYNSQMIGDYDCQPWTADNSVFNLPTGIQFQEINS